MSTPAVEPSGILLINKHAGATSHDIVNKVRRAMHTKRVGHTGTLDPMATGVLVVLVGRAAKACEYVSHDRKVYRATLRLGLTTDTEDTTGTVLTTCDTLPSPEQVAAICERFVGKIEQIPPMYSALKVDGQKLCDLARQGIEVERKARPIEIYALSCVPTNSPTDYTLTVDCSGGTYIRTLCADIGASLGCGGALATLMDTVAGCCACSKGGHCVTSNCTMEFLRPAYGKKIYCEATPKKMGRSLSTIQVTLTNDSGDVVATGTFTFFMLEV